jgi:hypothetical protein
MEKLKQKVYDKNGKLIKTTSFRAFVIYEGEQFDSRDLDKDGITKKDFHSILDKASQPIKHEAQSDSEKSET